MTKRYIELIDLMEANALSIADVMNITGNARPTVKMWRTANGKQIPAAKLELLKMKIESRKTV